MIVDALVQADAGALQRTPQPAEGVTYAHKVEKHEAQIDWTQDAATLVRRVRAFDPFPGASSALAGETVKLWAARRPAPGTTGDVPVAGVAPGTVLTVGPAGIDVATGDGVIALTQLQRAGGKRLAVADFLRGFDVQVGQVFG